MIALQLSSRSMRQTLILIMLVSPIAMMAESPLSGTITLEQKIGQMLMISYPGPAYSGERALVLNQHLQDGLVGGLIFFKTNIHDPHQFSALVDSISSLDVPYPLFLAVDEEGGKVRRLKRRYGFTESPAAAVVGRDHSPDEAFEIYTDMASQIRELGLNLNLAPVVDMNVNPQSPVIGKLKRSFSEHPDEVERFAAIFIKAHHDEGVLTCLKHYPGHGSAETDTHDGLTDISTSWAPLELTPFSRLIINDQVDMIMCGHLYHAPTDPDYPASISRMHINEILRGDLGYNGVVLTDDLQMGAIIHRYSLEEIIVLAIQAGNDILQFSNPTELDEAFPILFQTIVKDALQNGDIDMSLIDAAFQRISDLKYRLLEFE